MQPLRYDRATLPLSLSLPLSLFLALFHSPSLPVDKKTSSSGGFGHSSPSGADSCRMLTFISLQTLAAIDCRRAARWRDGGRDDGGTEGGYWKGWPRGPAAPNRPISSSCCFWSHSAPSLYLITIINPPSPPSFNPSHPHPALHSLTPPFISLPSCSDRSAATRRCMIYEALFLPVTEDKEWTEGKRTRDSHNEGAGPNAGGQTDEGTARGKVGGGDRTVGRRHPSPCDPSASDGEQKAGDWRSCRTRLSHLCLIYSESRSSYFFR